MKQQYFKKIECTLHSAEYVQIRSWLTKHEPQNTAIQEINQAVEHSFSPRPWLHQFGNEANETFARVFFILQKDKNKKVK